MLLRTRRILSLPCVLAAASLVATALPQVSSASISHPSVVKEDPANFTPNLQDDAVVANAATYAFSQSGSMMYTGGEFRTVRNAARTVTYTRYNIMAFNATTGAMSTTFVPNINGPVWEIATSGTAVYVGGQFTTVNGVARRGVVKLDGTTGAVDPAFNAALPSGNVTELWLVGGRLIIGGTFPKRLAALNPATGADTGYINIPITGTVASNAGATGIYRFAVNPAGTRLVAIGNFTTVGGLSRWRAFMLDLGTSVTVNAWSYAPLRDMCGSPNMPEYLRDVDFSPGGTYFVLVATGYVPLLQSQIGTHVCDAAARFEVEITRPTKPTWINYTGGDTLHSVAVTGAAVYVQGHQRWLNNPQGRNYAGPGAVSRQGIGAIHPSTGLALPFNPGKEGGVGGKEFLATSTGLWVGSDTRYFNGEYREGVVFLPL